MHDSGPCVLKVGVGMIVAHSVRGSVAESPWASLALTDRSLILHGHAFGHMIS